MRRSCPMSLVVLSCLISGPLWAQSPRGVDEAVVINEVFYQGGLNEDWVEIKNTGAATVDISSWWLCGLLEYAATTHLTILSGDLVLSPGEIVVLQVDSANPLFNDLDDGASDIGLYVSDVFPDPNDMVDFMQYGSPDQLGRSGEARDRGLWLETDPGPPPQFDFVLTADPGEAVAYCGNNTGGEPLLTQSRDFRNAAPTQGVDNVACALFDDGFESGDTSAWSASTP